METLWGIWLLSLSAAVTLTAVASILALSLANRTARQADQLVEEVYRLKMRELAERNGQAKESKTMWDD